MQTTEILKLLIEASTATPMRFNQIHAILGEEAPGFNKGRDQCEIDTPGAGISALMDNLIVTLYQNNPQLLPSMLPVFVLMCGDREKGHILP